MSEQTEQSGVIEQEVSTEDTTTVVENLETGVTDGEITANDEANQEMQGDGEDSANVEGQGQVSKTRNAKARLRRKLSESDARNAKLAEDNQRIQQQFDALSAKVDSVINPPAPRPNRVDFETEEEYEDTLHDWRNGAVKAPDTTSGAPEINSGIQAQPNNVTPIRSAEEREIIENFEDSMFAVAEKYDDFESVRQSTKSAMTDVMQDCMIESPNSGELFYHLAKNEDESHRIAGLSISQQVQAINELSKKFNKTSTNAPDPIETIGKGQAASSGKKVHPLLVGATFE